MAPPKDSEDEQKASLPSRWSVAVRSFVEVVYNLCVLLKENVESQLAQQREAKLSLCDVSQDDLQDKHHLHLVDCCPFCNNKVASHRPAQRASDAQLRTLVHELAAFRDAKTNKINTKRLLGAVAFVEDDVAPGMDLRSQLELLLKDSESDSLLAVVIKLMVELGNKCSLRAKADALFLAVDADNDGTIDKQELQELVHVVFDQREVVLRPSELEAVVDVLFEEGDINHNQCIDREEFLLLFARHPQLASLLQSEKEPPPAVAEHRRQEEEEDEEEEEDNAQRKSGRKRKRGRRRMRCWRALQRQWDEDPWTVFWLGAYIAINAALFEAKFDMYSRGAPFELMGYCIATARGSAQALLFNCFLILIPICRSTVAYLRRSRLLSRLFPFDSAISFHKMVAIVILLLAMVHTSAHMCDFARIAAETDLTLIQRTFGSAFGDKLPTWSDLFGSLPGASGVIMVFCFTVAYPLAVSEVRRNNFRVFWLTHHLLILFLFVLGTHGWARLLGEIPQAPIWIGIPLLLYGLEKVPKVYRADQLKTEVLDASIKPGNVVALKLAKPAGFMCTPGQYVFLNAPSISPVEWHPFSLTSAPNDDYISVHIRAVGKWTKELLAVCKRAKKEFAAAQEDCDEAPLQLASKAAGARRRSLRASPGDVAVEVSEAPKRPSYPSMFVTGAMGAPSQEFTEFPILVLVGAGIGVTPMASVLRHLQTTHFDEVELERLEHSLAMLDLRDPSKQAEVKELVSHAQELERRTRGYGNTSTSTSTTHTEVEMDPAAEHFESGTHVATSKLPHGDSLHEHEEHKFVATRNPRRSSVMTPADAMSGHYSRQPESQTKQEPLGHQRPRGFLKKVFFHWTSRTAESLTWFQDVMEDLNAMDEDNFVEIHNHLTSVKGHHSDEFETLNFCRELVHERRGVDIITGMKTTLLTKFGRPNFNTELEHVRAYALDVLRKSKDKSIRVGVFFCGPHVMSKAIEKACKQVSSRQVKFSFFTEQF